MKQENELNAIAGESKNLTEHNIEQLKQLFPEVFAEGKIDFDALKAELGEHVETDDERYQFTWAGKAQAKRIATTPSLGTLRPAPEESVNWDSTENLYIEGDNLEVLKLLQKSYFGKVKMIYIDPPYNTGKDFVYKDDFKDNLANYKRLTNQVDGEGNPLNTNSDAAGRYHSNWLNMMYPRLKLARNLLKNDGVIFISIDDNEVHNLRKMCDDIFGEENFISIITNGNNPKGRSDDKFVATACEYIYIYGKNIRYLNLGGFEPDEVITKRYNKEEYGRKYREIDLRKTGDGDRRIDRPNMFYYFYYERNTGLLTVSKEEIVNNNLIKIYPIKDNGEDGRWRWGIDNAMENISKLEAKFMPNRDIWGVIEKDFLDERKPVKPTSLWTFKDLNSERGSEQFIKLGFAKEIFPRPKPLGTLFRTITVANVENDEIVLDFFSGSSTTAHAVMQMNAEDDGNRKFIMVQIPEPTPEKSEARNAGYETIAEIGKERIRRAAQKIKEEHPETTADLGFRVLKLDTSNIKKWQPDLDNLEQDLLAAADNIMPERSSADLLFEVLLKYGLPLTLPVEELTLGSQQVFNVAAGSLVACFDENITLETVQAIIGLSSEDQPVLRVVFRDNGFKDDTVKTNAIQRLKQAGIEDVLSI